MSRASYIARVIDTQVGQHIAVVDLYSDSSPTMTVTNDAEEVVAEVLAAHGNLPVVYRDTEGCWDALRHDGERFTSFGVIESDYVRQAIDREF